MRDGYNILRELVKHAQSPKLKCTQCVCGTRFRNPFDAYLLVAHRRGNAIHNEVHKVRIWINPRSAKFVQSVVLRWLVCTKTLDRIVS